MKKKLLAMLLVLAMVISVVPLTVMAEDCEHENADYSHYVSNGKGQHDIICPDCGEGVFGWMFQCKNADTDYNGYCDKCGYNCCVHGSKTVKNNENGTHTYYCQNCKIALSTEAHSYNDQGICGCGAIKEACAHGSKSIVNNGNGTHTFFCRDCKAELNTEDHKYDAATDVCICGAIKEPCTHGSKSIKNNEDGTHSFFCRDCGEKLSTEKHEYSEVTDACICGAIKEVCTHKYKSVKNNEDGTHTFFCRDCGEKLNTEDHKYDAATDVCICGAIHGHECTFEAGVTSNEDGTHNVNCECGKYATYNCADYDGNHACDSCGYKMGCLFDAGVTSNGDGTHKVNCSCGEYMTFKCSDNDGNHACDSCGNKMGCLYDAGVTSNGDGTHKVNCSCGEYMTLKCLDPDGDGKCDSCGYQMYTYVCKHNGDLTLKDNGDGNTHKVICAECDTVLYEKEAHEYNSKGVCACGAKKTAETKPQNPNLDNVPKTGSQGLTAVGAALLLTAMAGVTGIVVIRKKHI